MSTLTIPKRGIVTDDQCLESAKGHGTDPEFERMVLSGFPETVYLLHLPQFGADKYAVNNATDPEGTVVDGLACFGSPDEIEVYKGEVAPQFKNGVTQKKSFSEARDLAKAKSLVTKIKAMFLWGNGGKIVEIHYVA